MGFDDLTTILIAREMDISVGTLYHYFPNKHAILNAIAHQWLVEYNAALDEIENWKLEKMSLSRFCQSSVDVLYDVYQTQRGILPLIAAISAVPELRELDDEHDRVVVERLSGIFKRLGIKAGKADLARLGMMFLEMTHALLMVAMEQRGVQRSRSLGNIRTMAETLLKSSS